MPNAVTLKTPKQNRSKARVATILSTTQQLLKDARLSGDTMLDSVNTTSIAREAGIPVGSIYQYFEDKVSILTMLYLEAYKDIENIVVETLAVIDFSQPFADCAKEIFQVFWLAAIEHPTYTTLTKWAIAQGSGSVWNVNPSLEGEYIDLIKNSFKLGKLEIPDDHIDIVVRTTATTAGSLVDKAIEEEDPEVAAALIRELSLLLGLYLSTYRTENN